MLSGPYLDRAPDLLLQPAPLYSLTHARGLVETADWLSGDHRPEGVYALRRGRASRPAKARRSRSPTSPAGSRMPSASSPTPSGAAARSGEAVSVFSEEEERLVEERLRGLGYLE